MKKEIASWKRAQERNELSYSFKYISHKNEVSNLFRKEEEINLLKLYIEDLSE
jgi:hypothetical protein